MPNQLETPVTKLDWEQLQHSLDENGYAKLPRLLDPDTCTTLINGYDDEGLYRKTIDMKRYRFGIGEYKYFNAPLPDALQQIREQLYPELAKTANRWLELRPKSFHSTNP